MARKVTLEPRQCERSILNARVKPHTRLVFEELAARFPVYYAWGVGATGDHAAGRALDIMAYDLLPGPNGGFRYDADGDVIAGPIRKGFNVSVADYCWQHRARLGLDYEIHDQVGRSNNPGGSLYSPDGKPRPYTGDSHANHTHLSFELDPPPYRPPTADLPDTETAVMSWQEKLQPSASARELAGWPEGFESTAENFEVGTHARVIEMRRYLETVYGSLLENMQQEDPRWSDLAAWKAAVDTKLDTALGALGELNSKLDALASQTPENPEG